MKILEYVDLNTNGIDVAYRQHAYNKSRFLRGAAIDESKIPNCDSTQAIDAAIGDAQPIG
ncbi:MAG: hypothetical protein ABIU95_07165 [Burkholderiales bacterium]